MAAVCTGEWERGVLVFGVNTHVAVLINDPLVVVSLEDIVLPVAGL